MDDVRTLAAARRRRRAARADVFQIIARRSMTAAADAYRDLGASARTAAEQITDTVAAIEVQLMWERA